MSNDVEQLADAVLYEGYNLYPYRPSALKNRHRWLFGCVLPKPWCERHATGDRWNVQTQCLLTGSPQTAVEVQVRFLQASVRIVCQLCSADDDDARSFQTDDGTIWWYRSKNVLEVDEALHQSGQEAEAQHVTRQFRIENLLDHERHRRVTFPAESDSEILKPGVSDVEGVIVRDRRALEAGLHVDCEQCSEHTSVQGMYRISVCVENLTDIPESEVESATRDDALLSSFLSLHVILHAADGEFVSSIDPPSLFREAAESCENIGVWPALVGNERRPTTMLAAPIVLGDFPKIAPESPGDLFDGTEIDELLSLRIQTLTDDEKREAASSDERTRQLLQRTESLDEHRMELLHGTRREHSNRQADEAGFQPGDRVRLRPTRRADAFDLMLDGKTAVITTVERDFEDNVHLAVTIDDDPGKDLGVRGMPGHRFFFHPDEVERLEEERRL